MSEFLRKDVRTTEYEIDLKLQEYSQISNNLQESKLQRVEILSQDIQQLLTKLTSINNQFTQNPQNRHTREHAHNLQQYTLEFNKISSNIAHAKDRLNLLHSYSDSQSNSHDTTQDYLLTERSRIDKSNSLADEILQQAIFTRDDLEQQKNTLFNGRSRLSSILVRFPMINSTLAKITHKKNRDTVILGSVIAFFLCFFIWYFLM